MNKVRSILVTIALAITLLSGLALQGIGSMANVASSHHVGSASSTQTVGKSKELARTLSWPCDTSNDC